MRLTHPPGGPGPARTLRRALVAGGLAVTLTVTAACTTETADAEGGATTVTMAVPQDFTALDPMNGQFVTFGVTFQNVTEALVHMDGQNSTLVPALAESWEAVNETTWRFKLRSGVKFHNGEALTAEAVKFSIERMLEPEKAYPDARELSRITGTRVVDETTVEFSSEGASPELPRSLIFLPILPPEYTRSDPDAINLKPIGTGPYQVASRTESELVLEPYADYWGEKPKLTRVTVISRAEDSARMAALRAGEVDIAWSVPIESAGQVPKVIAAPTLENNALFVNGEKGIGTDPRVREAINLAINRESLRTNLIGDEYSSPARCQWYPEGVFGFNPDLKDPPYDPERAKQLINEAGVAGQTVRLSAPVGRLVQGEQYAEAITADLQAAGLKVDLQIKDYQSWLKDAQGPQSGDHEIELVLAGINSFTGSAVRSINQVVSKPARLSRFPHAETPGLQDLITRAQATLDDGQREQLLREIGAQVCASNGFVFLYNYDTLWGAKENVDWRPRFDERIVLDTITLG